MRHHATLLRQLRLRTLVALLVLALSPGLRATTQVVFERKPGIDRINLRPTMSQVDDAKSEFGKALKTEYSAKTRGWRGTVLGTAKVAGPLQVRLHLRAEGLLGISGQLHYRVTLRDHSQDPIHDYTAYLVTSSIRIKPDGYAWLSAPLLLPVEAANYEVILTTVPQNDSEPTNDLTIWCDHFELVGQAGPQVVRVLPDKVAYRPGQSARASIQVWNPTETAFSGSVVVHDEYGITTSKELKTLKVSLAPGESRQLEVKWKVKGPESGRYLRATLADGQGTVLSEQGEYYAFASDPRTLAVMPYSNAEIGHPLYSGTFHVSQVSSLDSKKAIDYLCQERRLTRKEIMAWAANDLGGLLPEDDVDPYLMGEGRSFMSQKQTKLQVKLFKEQGVVMSGYINGHAWGKPAYEMFKRRPDLFMYGRDGEIASPYDMSEKEGEYYPRRWEYRGRTRPFFYSFLNPTLPEVRRYVADQIIAASKEVGFETFRWDVWSMEVKVGNCTMDGEPIARDWTEADRLSAESLAAVKALVAKELPYVNWGYNYGAPDENVNSPLEFAEKNRGGGWILDESICAYMGKNSPYHYWSAYRDRLIGWGDHVRQLGGIYNPFALNRGGGKYAVDRLYEGIFRALASGRCYNLFASDTHKVGQLGTLTYRYSNVYLDSDLRLQPESQQVVAVEAPDTLWWKTMVVDGKSHSGRPRTIVHLVNSPLVAELEENPDSTVRPPVMNVTVTCGKRDGKLPSRAWILAAEPLTPEGEPAVQAVPLELRPAGDRVAATVPSVLYLKTVVFEF